MKVKLSREKIINNLGGIRGLLQRENDIKLNYAVEKIEASFSKLTKEFQVYLEDIEARKGQLNVEREEICKKYCEKDDKGNPVIEGKVYKGLKDNKEFDKELENLKFYKKEEDLKKEKEKYLKEEIEIEGWEIKEEWLDPRMVGIHQKAISPFILKKDNEIKLN